MPIAPWSRGLIIGGAAKCDAQSWDPAVVGRRLLVQGCYRRMVNMGRRLTETEDLWGVASAC